MCVCVCVCVHWFGGKIEVVYELLYPECRNPVLTQLGVQRCVCVFVCVCVCVFCCLCMYVCTYTCVCARVYMCMYTYVYTCVCVDVPHTPAVLMITAGHRAISNQL